jgi:hypothetical protein
MVHTINSDVRNKYDIVDRIGCLRHTLDIDDALDVGDATPPTDDETALLWQHADILVLFDR